MQERIRRLTGEEAVVVVSRDDDPSSNSSFLSKQNPSKLIEQFAAETGPSAKSWIVGVGMLGEGVSIKRLKYRIHATNIRALLSFMQDLGRLLRKFPNDENPEPVETLIPHHPDLIRLAIEVMNEVAHVIQGEEEDGDDETGEREGEGEEEDDPTPTTSSFEAIASTGELGTQIVGDEEISDEYTRVAEWAYIHHPIGTGWGQTVAHFARMLQSERAIFEILRHQYESATVRNEIDSSVSIEEIPRGFDSKYATWLSDEKTKHASKKSFIKKLTV